MTKLFWVTGLVVFLLSKVQPTASAELEISVTSTSRSQGNQVEFKVNGNVLDIDSGRGVNMATLNQDGSMISFHRFDTHADGSEALVDFVDQLSTGTLVLVAARDDAKGNMTRAAKEALKSCGAQLIDDLLYRGSYAMIGVKNGVALDEKTFPDGTVAVASATYSDKVTFPITVISSSRSNGNHVIFQVQGQNLTVKPLRGLNVAVISPAGLLETFQVFDTHAGDSEAFEGFVQSLPSGTLVLVAVRDEAQSNMSSAAVDAMKLLGSTKIGSLVYRGSYALIGIKDGVALAEETFPDGTASVASAEYSSTVTVTYDLEVRSTSSTNGDTAFFKVDGEDFNVQARRGLNVVLFTQAGSLESFHHFDTHAADSEALVNFIQSLPSGRVLLVGVRDEAQSNMSSAALESLKICGATKIESLPYRGSYALIGVKDGPALAEEVGINEEDSVATATYSMEFSRLPSGQSAPSTTVATTTTTTVPFCAMMTCPAQTVMKPEEMWTLRSEDSNVCCTTAEQDMAAVGVRSAGYADGNEVVFYANGVEFYRAPSRGLTVLTVRADGTRKDSATFDTMKDGSEALAAYVKDIEEGTLVLVGARDEASSNLTSTAIDALQTFLGATKIQDLSFRGGYALVAVKGGDVLAEATSKTTEGYAVASGVMKVVISVDASKPVCDMSSPTPPVTGYVSQGNLNLDAGCRYRIFESSNAASCLSGAWILMTGSSNTLLEFANLLNFLAPDEYDIDREGEIVGVSAVTDVIIENHKVVHWDTVSNQLPECRQVDLTQAMQNRAACKTAVEELFAKAPSYSPSAIRITIFISFFWYRTELALDVVQEDEKWKDAQVAVVTQVGAWYNVCAVTKEDYCPRKELLAMDRDPAIEIFKDEMELVFTKMDTFCTSGRASQLGCYVQTISWTNGVRDNTNFQVMNAHIQTAMSSRLSSSFRLVDFFGLGGAMPEEVVNGHGSQMLNLWVWTVMFNAMCPAELAAEGSYAFWEGQLCSGTEARWENCPKYYPSCLNGPRCEKWECMNGVKCTLTAGDPPVAGNTAGMCTDPVNISSFMASGVGMDASLVASDGCINSKGMRIRVWCEEGLEWLLPAVTVASAVGFAIAQYLWSRLFPPKEVQKKGAKNAAVKLTVEVREVSLNADPKTDPEPKAAIEPRSPAGSEGQEVTLKIDEVPDVVAPERSDVLTNDITKSETHNTEMAKSKTQKTGTEASPSAKGTGVEDFADLSSFVAPKSKSQVDFKSEATNRSRWSQPGDDGNQECVADFPEPVKGTTPAEVPRDPVPAVETTNPKPSTSSSIRLAGNKYPLGLARFLGSTHVVLGHLFAKGVTDPIYFFGWGFTWVPWFFMLSGFVLFSAYLKNPKEETMLQYVLRRSTTIYPLYAFSLIPAFIIGKSLGTMQADWPTLLTQCFLMQAWIPQLTEKAMQMHCWFLSCMVVYWFFFKPLAYLLKNLTLLKTALLMTFFFFLPWLMILIPVMINEPVDWYKDHSYLATDTAIDIGVIMLKFHPICYFHVFILGMLLAKLRQLLDKKAVLSRHGAESWRNPYVIALQFVAPLGYLVLFLVFSVENFQAKLWGYKLSARISVLLPFQAMVLFGLAGLPSLPLPLFSYAFSKLDFLENYSYAVYVFQFLCYAVWPETGLVNLWWFLLFTYASAYLIAKLIQQPIQKWWAAHTTSRLCVPFLLAAVFIGCNFIPDPAYAPSLPDIPAQVMIDDKTMDVRLELTSLDQSTPASIINPSLLIKDNEVIVVARRHRRETIQRNGIFNGPEGAQDAVIIDQLWHSEIVMGTTPLDPSAWKEWPRTGVNPLRVEMSTWSGLRTPQGNEWKDLCVIESWIPSNNTLIRHVVTGPEDPKVVDLDGDLIMAFDSKKPHEGDQGVCHRNPEGLFNAKTQMYISADVKVTEPSTEITGNRLSYGQIDADEKNWIPFTYQGKLHLVYTPMPHVIVSADGSGSSEKIYSTSFGPLRKVVQEFPHVRIRGSASAIFVNNTEATPSLPRPHFLALLHLYDTKTGRYAHHAYRFGAEAPFLMLQMSDKLPLTEAAAMPGGVPFAFASGLAVYESTVVISYGAGDRDARALVMTLERLDEMFECSSFKDA